MYLSITRREEIIGFPGAVQRYYIDCAANFTEEEKKVIRARDLSRRELIAGPAALAASGGPFYFNIIGRFAVMMAILVILLGWPLARQGRPEVLIAGLVAGAVAAGLSVSAAVLRRINIRHRATDQPITVSDLLTTGSVSVVA